MIVLALETSGTTCGVALVDTTTDRIVVAEASRAHAADEVLLPMIQQLLAETAHTVDTVDTVAVSAGPGSFTGLRIGASVAKGLCFGGAPRLLPVATGDAMATAARQAIRTGQVSAHGRIAVLLPSHRDLYYCGITDVDAEATFTMDVLTADAVRERLSADDLLVGPGAVAIATSTGWPAPPDGLGQLQARFVALCAAERLHHDTALFVEADRFVPDYRQDFVPR